MKQLPLSITWEQMKRALAELGIDHEGRHLRQMVVDLHYVTITEIRTDDDGRIIGSSPGADDVSTVTTEIPFRHMGNDHLPTDGGRDVHGC